MKTYLDCIPCFLRQALDASRLVTDDETVHEQILYDVLQLTKNMDFHQPPPAIGRKIHQRIRELTKNFDPYHKLKQQHNKLALELYDLLEPIVSSSDDSLEPAIQLAIAGNIIDLGVKSSVSVKDIQHAINESLTVSFDRSMVQEFQSDIDQARSIVYLTDNAGEIVSDRLLIEQLPMNKITVAVKGSPVINEATMEDAIDSGLTNIVNVINNGSDGPGTLLETCSDEFMAYFNQSDLIIAKGQGNYESLSDIDKNIFFLLKAKCPVVARDLGCEVGDMILQKSKSFKREKEYASI